MPTYENNTETGGKFIVGMRAGFKSIVGTVPSKS